MINVLLNDVITEVTDGICISDALNIWKYTATSIAVAVNETFIPKSLYETVRLNDGDKIDIVTPMQGG